MLEIAGAIKLVTCAAAIVSILAVLTVRQRSGLLIAWAIFCAGLAAVMIRDVFPDYTGPFAAVLAITGCASCSCFWLVARGIFRADIGFGLPQAVLIGGIFAPSVINQSLIFIAAERIIGDAGLTGLIAATSSFQTMLSSTVLVLAFWEGLRGWTKRQSLPERRLRIGFLASYGTCVSVCVMLLDHGHTTRFDAGTIALAQAFCGLSIFVAAGLAVIWRQSHPLPVAGDDGSAKTARTTTARTTTARTAGGSAPSAEEQALGQWVRKRVEADRLFLDPDLKVATLARRLREPDYRVSRAITNGLGERNFNRFINRYRIVHAAALLHDPLQSSASILDIALESGFASIGPFNRAFKEQTGLTPRAFRQQGPAPDTGREIATAEGAATS
ncbi:AraC family transcriptional regulator [Maricaulis sp.]|uniref:helix-turn-helix domain-containing protein n=1 Tax=Maricaulis sp. TaxID=1486257 RepID=UPI0025BECE34|nr:AraC family transcriptional regulator [Maricaulis sp.]